LEPFHITDRQPVKLFFTMVADKIATVLQSRTPRNLSGDHYKLAAVLIPIQERDDGDHLVLTKRAEHLNHHRGQVAFPGGRVDADDRSELAAALREVTKRLALIRVTCGYSGGWIR
jgi:hypothetical protein